MHLRMEVGSCSILLLCFWKTADLYSGKYHFASGMPPFGVLPCALMGNTERLNIYLLYDCGSLGFSLIMSVHKRALKGVKNQADFPLAAAIEGRRVLILFLLCP